MMLPVKAKTVSKRSRLLKWKLKKKHFLGQKRFQAVVRDCIVGLTIGKKVVGLIKAKKLRP
jgi:hypothetical protein